MARFITELHMPQDLQSFRKDYHKSNFKDVPTPYTNDYPELRDAATKSLEKYGFKLRGKGRTGSVYTHSLHPFALKVFYNDNAYLSWIKFCKANQNNPYLPKIKGKFIRVVPKSNHIFAVRMEKLYDIEKFGKFHYLKNTIYHGMELLSSGKSYNNEKESMEQLEAVCDEHLIQIIKFLDDNEHKTYDFVDLHQNNAMQRRDGQLVIIDPVASSYPI